MENGYIAVIDSGLGGLSMLKELVKAMPNERYLYYGDNKNAPYGNRTINDLFEKTCSIITTLCKYPLKCVVVGCNTLSTTILPTVKRCFADVTFFGVYPPVESCVIKKQNSLLICTPNTAKNFLPNRFLDILILPNLAKDIERFCCALEGVDFYKHLNLANKNIVDISNFSDFDNLTTKEYFLTTKKDFYISKHQQMRYYNVILGCTHYFFIQNKIFNHFRPQKIIRGEVFTANKVKKYIENQKTLENIKRFSVLFLGESAFENEYIYNKLRVFDYKK